MLKVDNLSTGYGKKQILFDVSFEVKQGEMILLAGSNGSGKSTLLKTIYGILPPWGNGKIWLEDENITGKPTASLLNKGLLYIPQKNNLFEDLTVKENLEMAGLALAPKLLKPRIENVLTQFSMLVPHLQRIPMKLSGGERQLLTLAMATLHQPKLLLIDEPLNGLSPQNIAFVIGSLQEINKKGDITLMIIEHRVKECITIATKLIGLKLGRVFTEIEINQPFDIHKLHPIFV